MVAACFVAAGVVATGLVAAGMVAVVVPNSAAVVPNAVAVAGGVAEPGSAPDDLAASAAKFALMFGPVLSICFAHR